MDGKLEDVDYIEQIDYRLECLKQAVAISKDGLGVNVSTETVIEKAKLLFDFIISGN